MGVYGVMEIKKERMPFTYTLFIGSDCTAEELREFTRKQVAAEHNEIKQQFKAFIRQRIAKTASLGYYTAWFNCDELKPFFEKYKKYEKAAFKAARDEILEDYENRGFHTDRYGNIEFSISWLKS